MTTPAERGRAYHAEVNNLSPVVTVQVPDHDNERMVNKEYGLGRLWIPDMRDSRYAMERIVSLFTTRDYKYWPAYRHYLDQNGYPHCVEYSWHHFLLDSPTTHRELLWEFGSVYSEAQRVDEWEGENYDGTSVRAGAKVLQSRGLIRNYYWAQDIDTIKRAVLENGPVVVGTVWFSSMMRPDKKNMINCTGGIIGGHAYLINGCNLVRNTFRIKNSWSGWGKNQHAEIDIDEWATNCFDEWGEACIAVEV